jgi:hypothetical protein
MRPHFATPTVWTASVVIIVSVLAFGGVPNSMGTTWAWTGRLDALEVQRGAARRVVGPQALVAITSAGVWFTGGGTFVWNAFTELVAANQNGGNVTAMLSPMDAVVLDTNWWNARHDLAPTGTWYADRLLHLKGFVLPNGARTRHMLQLFLSTTATQQLRGFFIDDNQAQEFVEDPRGSDAVVVFVCERTPDVNDFAPSRYRFSFAYDRAPAPSSPSIVVVGMPSETSGAIAGVNGCFVRDNRRGRVRRIASDVLRAEAAAGPPIQFFTTGRSAVISAARMPRPVGPADRTAADTVAR